jgi:hypothetical protein
LRRRARRRPPRPQPRRARDRHGGHAVAGQHEEGPQRQPHRRQPGVEWTRRPLARVAKSDCGERRDQPKSGSGRRSAVDASRARSASGRSTARTR